MSPEERMARIVEAELLVYARDVENLATRYPELQRWVERIRAGALDVVAQAQIPPASERSNSDGHTEREP